MSLKGKILPNHVPINRFELFVLGLPRIVFTKLTGIEEELQTVDLPDRTTASGGNTLPIEFETESMIHHTVERIALNAWYKEGQDSVTPTYKKVGTLILKGLQNNVAATFTLPGLYIFKIGLPDFDLANEGEPAQIKLSFKADDILPV